MGPPQNVFCAGWHLPQKCFVPDNAIITHKTISFSAPPKSQNKCAKVFGSWCLMVLTLSTNPYDKWSINFVWKNKNPIIWFRLEAHRFSAVWHHHQAQYRCFPMWRILCIRKILKFVRTLLHNFVHQKGSQICSNAASQKSSTKSLACW